MLAGLVIGAVIGCATCCFLFHHIGLINYDLILKLIEGYIPGDISSSSVETNQDNKFAIALSQTHDNILGCDEKDEKSSPRSSSRKRRIHRVESMAKDERFPFNSPVMGAQEPLWSHRYSAKLQAAVSNIYNAWHVAESWSVPSSDNNGLQIFRKQRPNGVDVIKSRLLIPYPVSMIITEVDSREFRLRYEENTEDYRKLATYGQGVGVYYTLLKTPSRMVSQRDLVLVYGSCLTEKGGSVVLFPFTSVVFDSCSPIPGIVRADVIVGGWVFEVVSSSSTMATYIMDIDIKGSVPGWISNQSLDNWGRTPLNLCNFLKEKHGANWSSQRPFMSSIRDSMLKLEDNDGLIYGMEDDMAESVWDSSEESSTAFTELSYSDMQSSIGLESLRGDMLTPHEQAEVITKLNAVSAMVLKQTGAIWKTIWKRTTSQDKGVSIYRRRDGKSGLMGKSILKYEPQKIYDALADPSFRQTYDPMLKSLRIVEQFENVKVLHMHHQTTNFLRKIRRDMLVGVVNTEIDSKFIVVGTSVFHPACPVNTRMKRLNLIVSGWVVEEYDKKPGLSVVSLILDVDYGRLPKKVVRFVNKRQITIIHDLATAIKRRDGNKKS